MLGRFFRWIKQGLFAPLPPEMIELPLQSAPGLPPSPFKTMIVEAATCHRCKQKYPKRELIRMVEETTNREFGLMCKACAEVGELADNPNVGYINTLIPGERVSMFFEPDAAKLLQRQG